LKLETLLEQMTRQINELERRVKTLEAAEYNRFNYIYLVDGTDAPSATTDWATMYIDATDGDLKIIFENGTVKTITVDT
jgi:hypothetical protein